MLVLEVDSLSDLAFAFQRIDSQSGVLCTNVLAQPAFQIARFNLVLCGDIHSFIDREIASVTVFQKCIFRDNSSSGFR